MIDTFSTKKKKKPKEIFPPALLLECKGTVSHTRSRAQCCCNCGEYAHYELNHHLPF